MGALGDAKDLAIVGILGVVSYLILKPGAGRALGETVGEGAVETGGEVLSGAFAGVQSAFTGQSTAEIYGRVETGIGILNEMTRDSLLNWIPIIGPTLADWSYDAGTMGGGLNIGTVE